MTRVPLDQVDPPHSWKMQLESALERVPIPAVAETTAADEALSVPTPTFPIPEEMPVSSRRLSTRLECWLLKRLLKHLGNPPISVTLWDGQQVLGMQDTVLGRMMIRDRPTFWKLVFDPLYQFGEAYSAGRVIIEGDTTEFLTLTSRALLKSPAQSPAANRWLRWLHWPRGNTLSQSRDNIHHHYDIGNDFYQLWLDRQLVYTCAYFEDPSYSLEQAQWAKLELVCRKLRLQPGETVVEAGCGWGALALHMARQHGVTVKAYNISREQIAFARERAQQEGLSRQVEFIEDDWRNIRQRCDAFVSVGMLEHVGLANYRQLGRVIDNVLSLSGRGLIHSIGQNQPAPLNPWNERRIFPGAYPPTLRECLSILEPYDFSIVDVENLRRHYALTIRHWLERYEGAVDTVRAKFGEEFVRIWRLYLSASIAAFESNGLQLFQVVFARGDSPHIPWTRADLYQPSALVPPRSPTDHAE